MKLVVVLSALVLTAVVVWWGEESGWRVDRRGSVVDPSSPRPTTTDGDDTRAAPSISDPAFRIVDQRGDPISSAVIERLDPSAFSNVIQSTHTTDGDGVVVGLKAQSGSALAHADGYAWKRFTLEKPRSIVLDPEHVMVGRVVDDLARPMPQRKLSLQFIAASAEHDAGPRDGSWHAQTDADGRLEVRGLGQGFVRAYATWDGYEPVACEWAPGGPEPTLIAKRRPIVRGRVLDPDGRPVAAAIEDARLGRAIRSLGRLGESDAEGWFELTGLESGDVSLVATALGLESDPHALQLEPGERYENVILRLNRERVVQSYLSVRLVGREDRPVPGIRMHWMRQAWRPRGTRTNQIGIAVLPPPKSSLLMMISGGYTPPDPRSDENGVFRFQFDLPPGTPISVGNLLDSAKDGPRYLPTLMQARTKPNEDTTPVDLHLRSGVVRRIRVRPADLVDSLYLVGHALPLGTREDEASFLVDPDAVYQIAVDTYIDRYVVRSRWQPPHDDVVTLIELPDRDEDDSNPQTIGGRVLDASGRPAPGVTIAMVEGNLTGLADSSMTLADGSYAVSVRGSELHLQFVKPGYGTLTRRYRVGEPWPDSVTLQADARIRVTIVPPGNFRAADWRIEVRAAGWTQSIDYELGTEARDRFFLAPAMHLATSRSGPPFLSQGVLIPGSSGVLDQLPPGRLELRLWTDGYELKREVMLVEGETRRVEFRPR